MSIKAITWAFDQKLDDPTAKLVLLGIADKYNEDRGYAWPSVERLAEMADCTERTVNRKIVMLAELGLVQILRNPPQTNRYFLPTLTNCHPDTHDRVTLTPDVGVTLTPSVAQTIENDSEQYISFKSAFETFWDAVPRKQGKKGAMRAYKTALKDTDADTLLTAMKAFAADVKAKGTELRFIPLPATWLNQGRWDDDLAGEAPQPHENFGVSQRWMPKTEEQFKSRFDKMPNWYRQNRPDVISVAREAGWLNE